MTDQKRSRSAESENNHKSVAWYIPVILATVISCLISSTGFVLREYYTSDKEQEKNIQSRSEVIENKIGEINIKLSTISLQLENIQMLQQEGKEERKELENWAHEIDKEIVDLRGKIWEVQRKVFGQ